MSAAKHSAQKTLGCVISLRDGVVTHPEKRPRLAGKGKWNEAHLEAALALAPQLLGLEAASPVTLRGSVKSGPRVAPDQMYVDSMQRLHVIEIKKGEAGLAAIAQALAYGDMFRMLPSAAIEAEREFMEERCNPPVLLAELRTWAASTHRAKGEAKAPLALPTLSAPGWSARHVVVAKSFSEEARDFATELTQRGTSLELLQADMSASKDAVEVAITPFFREPWIEAAWKALEGVWSSAKVQQALDFVGWAEPLMKKGMSLALKKDRSVRLVIEIDRDGAWLCTKKIAGKSFPATGYLVQGWWYWHLEGLSSRDVASLAGRVAVSLGK